MTFASVALPPQRIWLRVADPLWTDPLNASYSKISGARWNAAGSYDALYLNADVATARSQIERMLRDTPILPEDLEDDAYVLIAATLPASAQTVADAVTDSGLNALGLHASYPLGPDGTQMTYAACQVIGARIHDAGLHGVWCRSACSDDGRGRELAWFPAENAAATAVWPKPLEYGSWRYAYSWAELALDPQPDPA